MSTPSNNNYAPPQSVVADIPSGDTTFVKASRVSRLVAVFVDGLLFGLPFTVSYIATFKAMVHTPATAYNPFAVWATMAATGTAFYAALLIDLVLIAITTVLVYRNGQTIGKKLLGIKVARTDGSRASLARIFWLRYLLNTVISLVPMIGGLYGLVDALMIFGESRRCCHDHIADTIVIQA
jgi:uncharacterized RDD family membrane protein YckC